MVICGKPCGSRSWTQRRTPYRCPRRHHGVASREKALLSVIQQAYVEGIKALGCDGISAASICEPEVVESFLGRPLDGGPSELFRGLSGVELVHQGLKNAIAAVFAGASWQRCRTHFMANLLTRVPKRGQLDRWNNSGSRFPRYFTAFPPTGRSLVQSPEWSGATFAAAPGPVDKQRSACDQLYCNESGRVAGEPHRYPGTARFLTWEYCAVKARTPRVAISLLPGWG